METLFEQDRRALRIPAARTGHDCGVQGREDWVGTVAVVAAYQNQIARSALNELILDRVHVRAAECRLIVADIALAMKENAAVTRLVATRLPGEQPPAK